MRSAFGLVQALIVIVLISGIMVIAMKYARISLKHTSDAYARESAELFLDSAVEATLLAISGFERNVTALGCLEGVSVISSDKRYRADVNISRYFLMQNSPDEQICKSTSPQRVQEIQTEETHGMVMLDITVQPYTGADANKRIEGKNIRLTRRTLQRP